MSNRASPDSFHPQIEGLRAIAAILVAVYHVWIGRISGGVDVFFVISGYLITASLYRGLRGFEARPILQFYSGLLIRLLPASMLVLAATLVGSLLFLSELRWKQTAQEIAAAAVYLENWLLALNAVDYLDRANVPSPVQHYWAMSMQFQFYLVWPFVIAGAGLLARRTPNPRRVMVLCLALVFLASLAYATFRINVGDQAWAYFDGAARIWEFSIGGVLFLLHSRISLSITMRALLGWIGLLSILACGMVLDPASQFPGYTALLPTSAAVMIVLSGANGAAWGIQRLLTSRALVSLGGVAYSIYLWHWPILIFYRAQTGHDMPSLAHGATIILASIALAYLTTHLVEAPLRTLKSASVLRNAAIGMACAVPVGIAVTVWVVYLLTLKVIPYSELDPARYPGARVLYDPVAMLAPPGVSFEPSLAVVREDLPPSYFDGCHLSLSDPVARFCQYGELRDPLWTLAIVGGSHSAQWLPALDVVAREQRFRILYATKSECQLAEVLDSNESCMRWREGLLALLLREKPEAIFDTANLGLDPAPTDAHLAVWQTLQAGGISVFALRDNPRRKSDVPECVARWTRELDRCRVARREVLSSNFDISSAPGNVYLADLSNAICTADACPAVVGNVVVYRDLGHLTGTYVGSLAPLLGREIERFARVQLGIQRAGRE